MDTTQRHHQHRSTWLGMFAAMLGSTLALLLNPAAADTQTRNASFTYYPNGLVESETIEPDNAQLCVKTTYTYDDYGNKNSVTSQNCAGATGLAVFTTSTATTSYLDAGNAALNGVFPKSFSNARGHTETRSFDAATGNLLSQTGPNGLTATVQYDAFGRKIRATGADGTYSRVFYCYLTTSGTIATAGSSSECSTLPSAGALPSSRTAYFVHTVSYNKNNVISSPFTRSYFDRYGRELRSVTQSYDGNGTPRLVAKDTRYNALGRAILGTQPYFLDTGSSLAAGSSTYGRATSDVDVLGRATATYSSHTGGSLSSYTYADGASLKTARSTASYQGLKVTLTDDKGRTRIEYKDILGRTIYIVDANGASLARQYDANNNLIKSQDALGNLTTISFDLRGRKKSMTDPDSGLSEYDYNALGQLVWQRNANQRANNQVTTLAYDILGRLTQRVEPEYTTTWFYDTVQGTAAGTQCGKSVGKLCKVATSHGVTRTFNYDTLGRLTTSTQAVSGGPTFTSTTAFDPITNRPTVQTHPTGVKIEPVYTALGYVKQVRNATNTTQVFWSATAHNAFGLLEKAAFGNGVSTTNSFDSLSGQLTGIQAGLSATPTAVVNQSFIWDSVGNLSARQDVNGDGAGRAVSETFLYDGINRLTRYTTTSTAITGNQRVVDLQYNAIGNILFKTDVGVYTYGPNGGTRPHAVLNVNGVTYNYDANGNVTDTANSGSIAKYKTIAYTSFNLPDSQTGVIGTNGSKYTWQYGPNHERVKEVRTTTKGTRTTWYWPGFEQETDETGTITNRHYIAAGGGTIAVAQSTGTHTVAAAATITQVNYWHKDHLGSLSAVTNSSGVVTARYAYDPFGKRRNTDGRYDQWGQLIVEGTRDGQDRGFTGHEHLDDVGIIHMNGRLFDPNIGRFMQADILVDDPGNLQAYNRYSYLTNNPLNATDPSGFAKLRETLKEFGKAWLVGGGDPVMGFGHYGVIMLFDPNPIMDLKRSLPGQSRVDEWMMSHPDHYAIGRTVVVVAMTIVGGMYCGDCGWLIGAAAGAGWDMYYVYLATGSKDEAGKAGAIAFGTSVAFWAVGGATGYLAEGGAGVIPTVLFNVAGHAAVGCLSAEASGGNCGDGAAGAAAGAAVTNVSQGLVGGGNPVVDAVVAGVAGGVGAEASGGNFSDGFSRAIMGYLFNHWAHMAAAGITAADEQESSPGQGQLKKMHAEGVRASETGEMIVEEVGWFAAGSISGRILGGIARFFGFGSRVALSETRLGHIFRDAEGHLLDTPANRSLLVSVANMRSARLGNDQFGNTWNAVTRADGTQVWVQMRNNQIINGGVNSTPRTFNPQSGLSSPTRP